MLFTAKPNGSARWDSGQVVVQDLTNGARTILVQGGTDARYLATGHLLYMRDGVLYATAFDVRSLRLVGRTVSILEGVAGALSNQTGAAQFTVSLAGTLVYLPSNSGQGRTLVWRDRQGRETPIAAPPRSYGAPRVSPDGTRIAVDARDQDNDIWIWDIARQILTRLTFDNAQDVIPLWTKDSRRTS
jgi:serine/threonine-protein kinase